MRVSSAAHLPQLTWLRGIAALFVLFSHINRANEASYSGELKQEFFLLNWLDLGSFGVALFFTLSGCTLYLSASKHGFPTIKHLYTFYLKRFFRIWPTFALALLAYLLAGQLLHDALLPYKDDWLASQFLKPYTITDLINYTLLVFNFTGPTGLFNNAFWSLPVEFQYYLVLPLLIVLVQRFGPFAVFGMVIISHLLYKADFDAIESTLVFRLFFTFCLGVYAGFLYQKSQFRLPAWFTLPTLLAMTAFVYLFSEGVFTGIPMPSEWLVYGFVAVGCVMLAVITELTLPLPIDKLLNFYGDVSYSLYLLHNLVIALVVVLFVQYAVWLAPYKLVYLTLATTAGSTFVAWLSYKYVELPSIRIGYSLTRH
jgi:peptidoglycan/LPS O-acetylase OafA/YrhL